MPKQIALGKKLSGILFWSIISAAFIGPGTVTTASNAGASYGTSLLWALVFSTMATIILQESAARITIATGKNLGEIIVIKYRQARRLRIPLILFLGILIGCAAYEAGNILGAISGLQLISEMPSSIFIMLLAVSASILLWFGSYKSIAHVMGLIVAMMGIIFLIAAFTTPVRLSEIVKGAFIPTLPQGSAILAISLIGTTIVPYNLFLASGISQGQTLKEMRFGIILAVLIGGIISMAILLAGMQVDGEFTFEAVSLSLEKTFGIVGKWLFAVGLFAAGFTSTITAPLAAAITGQSLLGDEYTNRSMQSWRFRSVWLIVIVAGLVFSLSGIKPIPAIIAAQAINGVLLPLFATFLFVVMNDSSLLSKSFLNGFWLNVGMIIIVGVTTFLGVNNIVKVVDQLNPGYAWQAYAGPISMVGAILLMSILVLSWFRAKNITAQNT